MSEILRTTVDHSASYRELIQKGGYDWVGPISDLVDLDVKFPFDLQEYGVEQVAVELVTVGNYALSIDEDRNEQRWLPELIQIDDAIRHTGLDDTQRLSNVGIISRLRKRHLRPSTLAEFLSFALQYPNQINQFAEGILITFGPKCYLGDSHSYAFLFGNSRKRCLGFGKANFFQGRLRVVAAR